jgi:hypothetical protein
MHFCLSAGLIAAFTSKFIMYGVDVVYPEILTGQKK